MGTPKRPVHEEVFLRSRVTSAFRTGWACLMASLLVQFGNMHVQWMTFPLFSFVIAVTVCGESTFGRALHDAIAVMIGCVQGVGMGMLVLQFYSPAKMTLGMAIIFISLGTFIVVYPTRPHVLSKRVALAQTAIIFVSASNQRDNMHTVYFPLRLGGTTFVGATCGMLSLLFPMPRLAFSEVQEQAKLASRLICERLKTIVDAFCINDSTKSSSLRLQALSLGKIESSVHAEIDAKEGDVQWEVPKSIVVRAPTVRRLTKGLKGLRRHLLGMDLALQSELCNPSKALLHSMFNDCLIYLTDWACLALRHASVKTVGSSTGQSQRQIIIEEGNEALITFDEVLFAARQKIAYLRNGEMEEKISAVLEDVLVAGGFVNRMGRIHDDKINFQSQIAAFFFLFTMKRFVEETKAILFNLGSEQQIKPKQLTGIEIHSADLKVRPTKFAAIQPCNKSPIHPTNTGTKNCNNCIRIMMDQEQKQSELSGTKTKNPWMPPGKLLKFRPNFEQCRTAFKMSLTMATAAFFGSLFDQKHGYWADITVGLGFGSAQGGSFKVANLRAQGTVAGTIYGFVASLATQHFPYLKLVALIPWVVFTSFLRQSKIYGYSGALSAFTGAVVVLSRRTKDTTDQDFSVIRIVEAFLGMASYILIELVILPRRAASLVRKEVVSGLNSTREFVAAVMAAHSGQDCAKCCSMAVDNLKQKESNLRSLISRQKGLVREATDEPSFWFAPFPGSTYSKLVEIQARIVDLLQFALCSLEAISKLSAREQVSIDRIHGSFGPAIRVLEEKVLPSLEFLEKVLQITSMGELLPSNTNQPSKKIVEYDLEDQSSKRDMNTGPVRRFVDIDNFTSKRAILQEPKETLMDMGPIRLERFMKAFEKGFEQVMTEMMEIAEDEDGETMSNTVMLSLSALAFSLQGLLKETTELEKAVHELLQVENPWSHIDFWDTSRSIGQQWPR